MAAAGRDHDDLRLTFQAVDEEMPIRRRGVATGHGRLQRTGQTGTVAPERVVDRRQLIRPGRWVDLRRVTGCPYIVKGGLQPLAGFQGQATEIEIHARELLKTRDNLNRLLAKHTGQPIEKIQQDTERDYFMSAEEAKTYGLIDEVFIRKKVEKDAK